MIRHNLDSGGPVELSSAIVASWARYAEAVDEDAHPVEHVPIKKRGTRKR